MEGGGRTQWRPQETLPADFVAPKAAPLPWQQQQPAAAPNTLPTMTSEAGLTDEAGLTAKAAPLAWQQQQTAAAPKVLTADFVAPKALPLSWPWIRFRQEQIAAMPWPPGDRSTFAKASGRAPTVWTADLPKAAPPQPAPVPVQPAAAVGRRDRPQPAPIPMAPQPVPAPVQPAAAVGRRDRPQPAEWNPEELLECLEVPPFRNAEQEYFNQYHAAQADWVKHLRWLREMNQNYVGYYEAAEDETVRTHWERELHTLRQSFQDHHASRPTLLTFMSAICTRGRYA